LYRVLEVVQMKKVLAVVVLFGVVLSTVALAVALSKTPKPVASLAEIIPAEQHAAPVTETVLPKAQMVLEVAPVLIISKAAPRANRKAASAPVTTIVEAGPCNWGFRQVVQGPVTSQVRGFCGG
jgi:hypothetical protein